MERDASHMAWHGMTGRKDTGVIGFSRFVFLSRDIFFSFSVSV